jgi:hypothetical protein
MKRLILLAPLLLMASACTTTTQAPSNVNAPTNTQPSNTTASATPKTDANASDSDVTAKEKQIWDNIKKKDPDAFAAMLADDFVYVSNDGVYDKAGTVNGIKQLEPTEITLSDWKTVQLGKDAAVVTYTVDMKGTSGGKPIPPGAQRAGSVWVNRGGKWVGVFHQDTPVEEPPKENTASNKPAAKATPAGEAKPAEPVSDDPVAREKQVWDAIKKKDYDRFASFLAEDQIEVFAWGVNDKAGSVSGIQHANLSSGALSDFKTLKVNDDISIVTYMIKGSGDISPTGERGSTLWVKRDGKWLAAYHQDTTVKPVAKSK